MKEKQNKNNPSQQQRGGAEERWRCRRRSTDHHLCELLGPKAGLKTCSFFKDELLQCLFGQVIQLHVKLERGLSDGLICRVVILLQIRMCQGLLHLDPLVGVKGQHLVQQVQSCSTRGRTFSEEGNYGWTVMAKIPMMLKPQHKKKTKKQKIK